MGLVDRRTLCAHAQKNKLGGHIQGSREMLNNQLAIDLLSFSNLW